MFMVFPGPKREVKKSNQFKGLLRCFCGWRVYVRMPMVIKNQLGKKLSGF